MKGIYINKLLATSIVSLVAANFLNANEFTQDVVESAESAYTLVEGYVTKKSTTGSKMDINLNEIPQSITVITNDMMRDRAVETIQNVTAYDASVTQVYGENSDTRTNYGRLRGIDHIYKSSFLDGLKLVYGGHLIPNYDPYGLQKVEVLKGPSSVLYGASGPGGLINLQSKKPNKNEEKEFGLSYSTFKNKSIFTDLNHNLNEKTIVRLTGKYKEGDNELKDSTNRSYFFNPYLAYNIDDTSDININASIAQHQIKGLGISFNGATSKLNYHTSVANNAPGLKTYLNNFPGNSALAQLIRTQMGAIPDAAYIQALRNSAREVDNLNMSENTLIGLKNNEVFEKNHYALGATYNKSFNDSTKFKSSFRAMKMDGKTHYSLASFSKLVENLTLGGGDLTKVPMEFIENDSKMKTFVIDNNLEHKFDNNTIENTSLVGVDFQYTDYENTTTKPVTYNFDLKNPNSNINITRTNDLNGKENQKQYQAGFYASNNLKIKDKFVLSTSLRADIYEDEKKDLLKNSTSKSDDTNISGRLGLVYLADNGLSPYITYSTSYQSNLGSDKDGNKFTSTTGEQVELGLKFQPKEIDALFTFAAFDLKQKDVVSADPTNRAFNIQAGDNSVKGVEFNIQANPTENSNLTFSIAKLEGEQKNSKFASLDGKDLGDLPNLSASIWADYTFKNTSVGDLNIGAGVKYTGDAVYYRQDYFDVINGQPVKAYDISSYTIVDTAISTDYKDWDIGLNVYNVFDKKSSLAVNSIQEGVTQGRTMKVTAKYKF